MKKTPASSKTASPKTIPPKPKSRFTRKSASKYKERYVIISMSMIEIDPAVLHALGEAEFRLYALAGEAPVELIDFAPADTTDDGAVIFPVSAATPEAGEGALRLFSSSARRAYGAAEPLRGSLERERALGSSFPPDA